MRSVPDQNLPTVITAQLISYISNPLFVLLFAFILGNSEFIYLNPGPLLMFVCVGMFLPTILYAKKLLKHKQHFFHFIALPQEERESVYLSAVYSFIVNIIIFAYLQIDYWLYNSIFVVIFFGVMYLSNRYIDKVSLHASAFTFSLMYLVDKGGVQFSLLFYFLPLIFWARIKLHRHTWAQLFVGTVVGMFIGLLTWTF